MDHNQIEIQGRVLKPRDILHITLDAVEFGDGQPPWVPGPDELKDAKTDWEKIVPQGVKVIVTNSTQSATIIPCDAT